MNQNNKANLLGRIKRVREFLDSMEYAVEADVVSDTKDISGLLAHQMELLLDEVDAAEDGC